MPGRAVEGRGGHDREVGPGGVVRHARVVLGHALKRDGFFREWFHPSGRHLELPIGQHKRIGRPKAIVRFEQAVAATYALRSRTREALAVPFKFSRDALLAHSLGHA